MRRGSARIVTIVRMEVKITGIGISMTARTTIIAKTDATKETVRRKVRGSGVGMGTAHGSTPRTTVGRITISTTVLIADIDETTHQYYFLVIVIKTIEIRSVMRGIESITNYLFS